MSKVFKQQISVFVCVHSAQCIRLNAKTDKAQFYVDLFHFGQV